jgi:hypothetical protein
MPRFVIGVPARLHDHSRDLLVGYTRRTPARQSPTPEDLEKARACQRGLIDFFCAMDTVAKF